MPVRFLLSVSLLFDRGSVCGDLTVVFVCDRVEIYRTVITHLVSTQFTVLVPTHRVRWREIYPGESLGPGMVQAKDEDSCLALSRERDDSQGGKQRGRTSGR